MVAPTFPTVPLAVDFSGLIKQIETVANLPQKSDLDALSHKSDLDALSHKSDLDALSHKSDLDALPQKSDLDALPQKSDLDALPQKSDLAAAVALLATKEDIHQVCELIAELRCLVLHLWWLDHGCRHLFTGHTDHITGLVFEAVRFRDALQSVTPDAFRSAAEAHEVEERLLPCDIEVLLGAFTPFAAHLTSQTAQPASRKK